MRKSLIVFAFALLMVFGAGQAIAQQLNILATCNDTAGTGYIALSSDFTINIECYNTFAGDLLGVSIPLRIYSPDGSITTLVQRDVGGATVENLRDGGQYADGCITSVNGWDGIWNLLSQYTGVSWDGNMPDTINHSGITLGGYANDTDTTAYITISYTSGTESGTICVDSVGIPGTTPPGVYDWLFDDPNANFNAGPNGDNYCWQIGVSDVRNITRDLLPKEFALGQNFPNPFNMTTKVEFAVPFHSDVTISIFNILGQKIKTIVDGEYDAGYYEADWNGTSADGTEVASGMYFYKIEADDFASTKKLMLLK